jgi:tRNA nucleotidyltransferase (CCA-adding enzyme)
MYKGRRIKELNLKIGLEDIDPGALLIVKRLSDSGYEALVVGGCIRNLIMVEEAHDWDITTSATPEEISRAFKGYKVIPVGEKYGTIMIVIKAVNYQVTTFRGKDKLKGIEETEVAKWTSLLLEDLKHRDFTINALAWGEKEGVLDYFKGLEDIKRRVIKGVEDPSERIKEDPLRMLRAIRMACKLDFKIDQATLQAIKKNSVLIKKVSPERIRDELIKILLSNFPKRGFKLLQQLGLLQFILPELERGVGFYQEDLCPNKDLFEHILNLLNNLPPDLALRLVALLSEVTQPPSNSETSRKEFAAKILRRLKFKNSIIKKVSILVQEDWRAIDFLNPKNIRQFISKCGEENILNVLELKRADIKIGKEIAKLKQLEKMEQQVREVLEEKPPVSLKDLAINGKDLIDLGYQEGVELGGILKRLLEIVIDKPELNKKEMLLKLIIEEKST